MVSFDLRKGTFKSLASTFASNDSKTERWRVRESIGRYGMLVIAGGAIISPVMLGLLAVLWGGKGPGSGETASASWRSVVLRGWAPEAITLCSLVIQVCTSAQALICTSLAAATLLETTGVPLSQVAEFSTMRGANGGPWRLVYLMSRSSIRNFFSLQFLLMLVLFLGTLATQFASTILVADLDVSSITGNVNHTRLNLTLSDSIQMYQPSSSQWEMKPTDYSAFGEIPSGISVEPTARGFSDTGNVRRIFVPLQHENRTNLHHYVGGAYGINSRVACTSPVLTGQFEAFDPGSKPLPYLLTMMGNISYEATFANAGLDVPSLCADGTCLPSQFNCTMPTAGIPGRLGTFLCIPSLSNVIDTDMTFFPDGRNSPVTPHSMVFLVTRNNGSFTDWGSFVNNVSAIPDTPTSRDGEWASWKLGENVKLDASLCFSSLLWDFSHVDMSTTRDTIEPAVSLDPKTRQIDTAPARTLLGVNPDATSPSDRQLLAVNAIGNTSTDSRLLRYLDGAINAGIFGIPEPPSGVTINGDGASYGASSINPFFDYPTVVQDVLNTTNRPALAVQGMLTIMAMSLHYAQIQLLDVEDDVSLTVSVPVTIPVRWTGLAATAAVVAANLACAVAVAVLFLRRTRHSKQGHFWHAVAQLVCESTAGILRAGPEARDDRVAREVVVPAEGGDPLVVIGRCKRTGRVQVLRKEDVDKESV
ncbi:ethionine resistance protein [Hypoxylon texense]